MRSARPTAARGTRRSSSTAATASAANRPNPARRVYEPGHRYPVATQEERDHIPIVPPSPTRLLARVGPLSGERLGLEIAGRAAAGDPGAAVGTAQGRPNPDGGRRPRRRSAGLRAAHAPCDSRRAGAVDARGHRAVQPHGPPAPALRRRLHAGGRGDARDRPRVGAGGASARLARLRERARAQACAWRCWS